MVIVYDLQCKLLTGDNAGGRFKKEVVVDGQSYLLLIRDEGGPPDMQVGRALVLSIKVNMFLSLASTFIHLFKIALS